MRLDWIYLLGAVLLACEGCRQFYRSKNVDRLEQEGKITPAVAARLRRKPKWHDCLWLVAVLGFLAKAFFEF